MSRAVLSAGSNVGDVDAHLARVVEAFADELVAVSAVYATAPWGGVEQADFHNITLVVAGPHPPRHWLTRGADLEAAAERTRDIRWGPRTLDVDVISVHDDDGHEIRSDDPDLTLPHPRAAIRAFVLIPWLEIEPGARLWTPAGPTPITELIDRLDPAEVDGVRRVSAMPGAAT